ncbi:MAG TPA: TonB-dependent siderophore receptor [Methylophilus sp.]
MNTQNNKSVGAFASNPFALTKLHAALYQAIGLVASAGVMMLVSQQAYAEETSIELDTIEVQASKISDTKPVKGYHAKKSVSATKTDTLLRDTPQSITVIPQDLIKDQSIQSVSEAVRYVPGVQAAQGEGNRDALVFRGNITTGDLFVDGLRDDVQTYRDFYNTDRIEVLKGPNGMIFGRGGAGGALNRVSKEAGWDPISELTASYGAFDYKRIAADYGQAINDEVAFRLNAVYEDSGSYRDGVDIERYGVTPTFTIRPDDKTKMVFSAEYFKDKRTADRGVPSVENAAGQPRLNRRPYEIGNHSAFFGSSALSPTETETVAFNAIIEHAFDNGVGIKNSTRYANYNKYYQNVFADSSVANNGNFTVRGYVDFTDRENIINQTDLTYTANWGSVEHKLLAGVELATQDTDNSRLAGFFNNSNATSVTLNANNATEIGNTPVSFRANLIDSNNAFRNNQSTIDVLGFYLQDQIKLSEHWQAIVGVRHDRFETDFDGVRRSGVNTTVSESFNVTDTFLSPRAGLIFKPVEAVSLYGNYSVSYVPRAGDQLTSLTVTNASFKPEKFINYEVGAKWDVNPNLALTAAVYKLERENVQVTDPNNASLQILVDGQETKGVELGITGNITEKWSVFGGVAFQDGEVTKQQGSGANAILKGAELGQTPDRTLSLWNKYEINDMWAVALGVISTSDRYALSPTATQSTLLPGYTRYDAAIFGKFSEKLSLQINLENLTNKEYALYAHNNQNITPGSPITGRATLIYNF